MTCPGTLCSSKGMLLTVSGADREPPAGGRANTMSQAVGVQWSSAVAPTFSIHVAWALPEASKATSLTVTLDAQAQLAVATAAGLTTPGASHAPAALALGAPSASVASAAETRAPATRCAGYVHVPAIRRRDRRLLRRSHE